jgi:hypothetical protein
MLGHLKPRFCQLAPASKQHYSHLYCSICYSLRQQFGLSASIFINHELTLSLAAFPDYATMKTESCACPAKLFCGQKPILRDALIDKAAQLCLLLVWIKLIDSETDSPAFYKKRLRHSIEHKVQPILAKLTPSTRQFIDSYLLLIRANSTDFSTTVKMSGLLAQHVFQELCHQSADTQNAITNITLLLGELITVADALLDVKQDIKNQQYNPIIHATEQNSTTLKHEYALLKTSYQQLVQHSVELMHAANLSAVNPLFNEILQQSLHNLTRSIQRADNALFATNANQQNESRTRKWCECADGCCDCFGCCDCGGASEGGSSCCECCSCGDCSC